MRMNPLPPNASFCAYQQHFFPAFIYPLVAQRLTTWDINRVQSPIIIQLLHQLNLSSTMSRRFIHLPSRFGGAGIPNWAVTTCARQIEFFQQALDAKTFYGHTTRTSLHTSQLEFGHSQNLLATTVVRLEGMTSTWITNLHQSCVEFGISITGGWCAPLQRTNDQHIATTFNNNFPNNKPKQMRLFRECFRHMNVTTLADITNAAGTHLVHGVRQLRGPVHPSIYHFQVNPLTITGGHRNIWRNFLNAITLISQDELNTPLGAWTTTPSTHRPYRLAGGSLYKQHANKQWYRHQLCDTHQTTCTTYRRYSSSMFFQQTLLSHNIIMDVDIRG